ncbi:uncharacterized protein LOC118645909 [Monomorium pharaonis]|uniref:uncharacterized protein LOC118645909 n=1 Tax=Monomorium pharaonis TaxID=307658 RepID=UPI001745E381|nr:uncharacterized protein LOC118645909 [Monomorium pharaonis]XP_036143715.1 uncharacterized protein LOC118645909 [Monomorium pharaonis]
MIIVSTKSDTCNRRSCNNKNCIIYNILRQYIIYCSCNHKKRCPQEATRLFERLDRLDEQMRRFFYVVQDILKNKRVKRSPTKPTVLPITSVEQMEAFEHIEEIVYLTVVRYFEFFGGFHIKEIINTCLKETVHDSLTVFYIFYKVQ